MLSGSRVSHLGHRKDTVLPCDPQHSPQLPLYRRLPISLPSPSRLVPWLQLCWERWSLARIFSSSLKRYLPPSTSLAFFLPDSVPLYVSHGDSAFSFIHFHAACINVWCLFLKFICISCFGHVGSLMQHSESLSRHAHFSSCTGSVAPQHVGCWLPSQGSSPHPLHCKADS